MDPGGILTQDAAGSLERFQAKWKPVRRPETRYNNSLDHFQVSMKHENDLGGGNAVDIPDGLLKELRRARRVVVSTGAGVSAESGIPTFRESLTGLWEIFDPEKLATPAAFERDPDLVWGWYEYRRAQMLTHQPNPAHHAIAALAAKVPELTVITQNVDDLHERAGSRDVIHLHGSFHAPRCSRCHQPFRLAGAPDPGLVGGRLAPPTCEACGGLIRPGIVWFGEALPPDAWTRAAEAALSADVFLSVGTSSVVYPAAALPFAAAEEGAVVVEVNPEATSLTPRAEFVLRGKAGAVLPGLVERV
jgi:NAD-dependent deacetylase